MPEEFAHVAISHGWTVVLLTNHRHLQRVVGSLKDAILLSLDRQLLQSVLLFRKSDLEDFEYKLLTALMETVRLRVNREIFVEGDNIDKPAL